MNVDFINSERVRMDLSKVTNEELVAECKKRGISILSDSLIRLWTNQEDECWNDYGE